MGAHKVQEWRFSKGDSESARTLEAAVLIEAVRTCRSVRVEWAIIPSVLDLSGITYECALSISHTRFDGLVDLRESRFDRSLKFLSCQFTKGFDFSAVRISGGLALKESVIGEREGPVKVSSLEQVRVEGHLEADLLKANAGLYCVQASIGGYVDLRGSVIRGDLNLENACVAGSFFAGSADSCRSEIDGYLSLAGAKVGRDVSLTGIHIGKDGEPRGDSDVGDVILTGTEVGGSLFCGSQTDFRTEIRGIMMVFGAKIGGQLVLHGAQVGILLRDKFPLTKVLVLQSAEIRGGLYCEPFDSNCVEIYGHIYGVSARIAHRVDFDRAVVHGDINFRRAVISGVLMCAYDQEWYEQNPTHPSAKFKGRLNVRGNMLLSGVELQKFVLDGRLFDISDHEPQQLAGGEIEDVGRASRLRLDRARLVEWQIEEKIPDKIDLDGIRLDEVQLPNAECSFVDLLSKMRTFRKSTYLAFESFLRNKGFDEEARDVYIAMCDRDLPMGRTFGLGGAVRRLSRWLFLGVFIGYGARPLRLVIAILLALGISVWLFSSSEALVLASDGNAARRAACPSELSGFWTALEVALCGHFPMFSFLDSPPCVPSLHKIPYLGITFHHYALLISILSWVLVPLALIGLTGIVRQKE